MGKRKYDRMEKILNRNSRNVTYLKRTKGLIKKSIELSLLCEQDIFVFIYDKEKKRVLHYASNQSTDFMQIFDQQLEREFLSNSDYSRVGGLDNLDENGIELSSEVIEKQNYQQTSKWNWVS